LPSRSLAWASDRAGLAGPSPAPVGLSSAQPLNIYAGLDLAQPSPKIKNKKIKIYKKYIIKNMHAKKLKIK